MNSIQSGVKNDEDFTNRTILDDLQLAAELGKSLLEHNKELENALRLAQTSIDDQRQEIEYLTKQVAALREGNDSRLRIYEQLEISVHDLERANHRLVLDNASEKKRVKSLSSTIEGLEIKNEDLLSTIDNLRLQIDILKKKTKETSSTPITSPSSFKSDNITTPSPLLLNKNDSLTSKSIKTDDDIPSESSNTDNIEDVSKLLSQLREFKTQYAKEQRKVTELEEQLNTVTQQNQVLENQIIKLHHKDEDVKSVHEEFTLLEEVRQGQLCCRCLRNMDSPEHDDNIRQNTSVSLRNLPEDDDPSILEELMVATPYVSDYDLNVQDFPKSPLDASKQPKNHYQEVIRKYESLFDNNLIKPVQRKEQFASLQEELRNSGEYGTFSHHRDQDYESGQEDGSSDKQKKSSRKIVSHTPTDFSEAETSSSGFADETSTKSTQTDGIVGSLLCAITDSSEEYKLNNYDNISPIDSRFRKTPEYRELFKEIFDALKNAAENKEQVLDLSIEPQSINSSLCTGISEAPNDSLVDYPDDDTESIQSSTLSLPVSVSQQSSILEETQNEIPSSSDITNIEEQTKPQEPVLRPLIKQSFDYIQVEHRKRSSSRRRKQKNVTDRSDSPMTHIIGSPKISYTNRPGSGRRRRELRNASLQQNNDQSNDLTWNGNSVQFWSTNRSNIPSPTPSQSSEKGAYEFKPSVASQEIKKLKSLDKSYAEVLKLGEGRKREHQRHRASKGTTQYR